jgi:N-acetylmuramoyl-L-alanine amidase
MEVFNLINALPTGKGRYKLRSVSKIDSIIIHHSATTSGSPQAFAHYHVAVNGWPGISYHYVIGQDGAIFKCQPATSITWHAKGANGHGLGICLVGNFDTQKPTEKQLAALVWLCRTCLQAYPTIRHILGHREVPGTKKSCPGKNVDMDALRETIGGGGGDAA